MSLSIAITAASSVLSMYHGGVEKHVITDSEIREMRLGPVNLKTYADQYTRIRFGLPANYNDHNFPKCDSAYLKDPTQHGHNTYRDYDWPEVKTIGFIEKVQLLGFRTQNVNLDSRTCENLTSFNGLTCTATLKQDYSQKISVTSSTSNSLSNSSKISTSLNIKDTIGGGYEYVQEFQHDWGTNKTTENSYIIGAINTVSYRLKKGEKGLAILKASSARIKLRVFYNVTLDGAMVVNYPIPVHGHYLWSYPIDKLFRKIGKQNKFRFSEDIEMGYFFNGNVTVLNVTPKRPSKIIKTVPARITTRRR